MIEAFAIDVPLHSLFLLNLGNSGREAGRSRSSKIVRDGSKDPRLRRLSLEIDHKLKHQPLGMLS